MGTSVFDLYRVKPDKLPIGVGENADEYCLILKYPTLRTMANDLFTNEKVPRHQVQSGFTGCILAFIIAAYKFVATVL